MADGDDRIEEAADLLDHAHQPLDVRVGRIALIRRRLDARDRQRDEQQRLPAERIAVAAEHGAAVLLDLRRERVERAGRRPSFVSAGVSPTEPAATFFRRTAFFFAIGAS